MNLQRVYLFVLSFFLLSTMSNAQSLEQQAKSLGISQSQIDSYMNGSKQNVNSSQNGQPLVGQERTRTEQMQEMSDGTPVKSDGLNMLYVDNMRPISDTRFGESIFMGVNSSDLTFEPNLNIPTPQDYKLAAGDEVNIDVWGASEQSYTLTITPEGTILIPGVGPVSIGSLTINEAKGRVTNALSSIYSGLGDDNIKIDLSLGKIRSIKVNVVGEAKRPGTYTLPSLATLFNALYYAGGSNEIGSLRDIKLYRGGKEIASFDVYDFIMNGNDRSNVRLEDNDVVIIDPYKNIVTVKGDVKREMRYELTDGESVNDLLLYTGGFKGGAYTDKLTVSRKNGNSYSINTVESSNYGAFNLLDGDLIEVGSSIEKFDNRIEIKGAVWRAGFYELSEQNNTVSKLLKTAGGIKGDAYLIAQITRMLPDYSYEILSVNLADLLSGKSQDIKLTSDDKVFIPSVYELKERSYITVTGEVNNAVMESEDITINKKVEQMINEMDYQSLQMQLSTQSTTDIAPTTGKTPTKPILPISSVNSDENGVDSLLYNRLKFEQINDNERLFNNIKNRAEIERKSENIFDFERGMTLLDAIIAAGGLKESAAGSLVSVSRRIKSSIDTNSSNRSIAEVFKFNVSKDLNIESSGLAFELEPYDIINVQKSPNYYVQQIVIIEGEVVYPGNYTLTSSTERLSTVIERAGGFTKDAFIKGTRLVRKKSEAEIEREKSKLMLLQRNSSIEGSSSANDEIMVDVEPTYSIGIDIQKALDNPNSSYDPVLRADDEIIIPQLVNTVKISGAVLYPNTVTYSGGKNYKYYLENAGGYVKRASKKSYVVYMNGTVTKLKASTKIEPGCEIVIPMKPDKLTQPMNAQGWLSIGTSVTSLAVVASSLF